jgi:hypothetical protein
MRLKMLLITVFAAGLGASYALADGGHGNKGEGDHHGSKCTKVHVQGTVASQTLTVTLDRGSRRLNLAPGSQVVLQVGAAGQTVRVNAEACSVTTGSSTQLQVKSAELNARNTAPSTTTATTTTAATTTAGTTTTTP